VVVWEIELESALGWVQAMATARMALQTFNREKHGRLFFNICGEHSEVNPVEGYPAQGTERQRRRSMAELQQKARALANEIRIANERMRLLQQESRAGTWEMDLSDETFSFSWKAARILGVQARPMSLAELLLVLPYSGDCDSFVEALHRAHKGLKEFVTEFHVANAGECRVVSIRGKTFYNGGQPLILGVVSDITAAS